MEKLALKIIQGKTFNKVIRWEKEPFIYKAIESIARTAPVRITTVAEHGIPEGWRVAVVSAGGMRQINAENSPPKARDFVRATAIAEDVIDLNTINAAEFSTYTSGGYVVFYTPASLAGCTARMSIKDRVGGTLRLALTSGDGITLNDTLKTITIEISADDTADLSWTNGVYDLEIEDGDGFVTGLFFGTVTVTPEVTT